MKVLLVHLDGRLPNIALMRLSVHHKAMGDTVEFHRGRVTQPDLFFHPDRVYASLIFEKTRPYANELLRTYPGAILGGTGWDVKSNLESLGVGLAQDYSLYPGFLPSIGFTSRGCRMKCSFCVVPVKEGPVREEQSAHDIWRGDPWPRELLLLDNDVFGSRVWHRTFSEIRDGGFKVSFSQGINARFLTEETAEAIASVRYYDDSMTRRQINTAWDNRRDEDRLFRGLNLLVHYGVRPCHILVYMLIGYWPGETESDWLYRWRRLTEWGAFAYPMPYVRTPSTVGFQRWAVGSYGRRGVAWEEFKRAKFQPVNLEPRVRGRVSRLTGGGAWATVSGTAKRSGEGLDKRGGDR